MTQYINTTTNTLHSEADIRAAFPTTSFPSPFVPPDEYKVVFPAPPPTYDSITQSVRSLPPALTSKGHYEEVYEVVDLDAETVSTNKEAKKKADNAAVLAQIAEIESKQARAVREAALGNTQYLQDIETAIVLLRGQLQG